MKFIFVLITLFFVNSKLRADEYITVGTFNIEWLGDGIDDQKPRNKQEYAELARVIKELNADVLALQEIENQDAIKLVLNNMPQYNAIILSTNGKQNVGFLYKKDIKIINTLEYKPLQVIPNKTRSGFIVTAKKGNFDFKMMIVHLKSTSSFDNTNQLRQKSFQIRNVQVGILNNWADSCLKYTDERDLVILGDFNDHIYKPNSQIIKFGENKKLVCLTKDLKSCLRSDWYTIDNIFVSKSVEKRVLTNSVAMENFKAYVEDKYKNSISDHCPVIIKLNTSLPDND